MDQFWATDAIHVELSEATRAEIARHIGLDRDHAEPFLRRLDYYLSFCLASRKAHRNMPRKAQRKTTYRDLRDATRHLLALVQALPAQFGAEVSRETIPYGADMDSIVMALWHLADASQSLYERAEGLPTGRPREPSSLILAHDIAQAFEVVLKVRPTAARGGKYESVLRLVFVAAREHGEYLGDEDTVHQLALKVLKRR